MAESLWHATVETDPGRRNMFETIVLMALWVLIRCAFGARPYQQAMEVRQTMIDYMDVHGPQRDEARQYRRTHTFAVLPTEQK